MPLLRLSLAIACLATMAGIPCIAASQAPPPPASAARILLLPRRVVAGERATLAVLDVNGRLTPGVTVKFSNGDQFTTDATGRALFVAPLHPGIVSASIAGRPGRVATTILSATEAKPLSVEVSAAPRFASLTDRFELFGRGFCGEADANQVVIAGQPAIILASSPVSLVIVPPADLEPGTASVEISCAKQQALPFSVVFVRLDLEADSSPLEPGEHRALTVRVEGSEARIPLEARNLAPEIAELGGGNPAQVSSSGGHENVARFDLLGRKNGGFLISIRLVPSFRAPLR